MHPLLQLLLRILLAGAVVIAITEIAQRWPRLAAILLFVPLAIPVIFVSMYLRDPNPASISRLSRDALILIPLSLPMFLPIAFAPRWNLSFWPALAIGLFLASLTITGYLYFTTGRP